MLNDILTVLAMDMHLSFREGVLQILQVSLNLPVWEVHLHGHHKGPEDSFVSGLQTVL